MSFAEFEKYEDDFQKTFDDIQVQFLKLKCWMDTNVRSNEPNNLTIIVI